MAGGYLLEGGGFEVAEGHGVGAAGAEGAALPFGERGGGFSDDERADSLFFKGRIGQRDGGDEELGVGVEWVLEEGVCGGCFDKGA